MLIGPLSTVATTSKCTRLFLRFSIGTPVNQKFSSDISKQHRLINRPIAPKKKGFFSDFSLISPFLCALQREIPVDRLQFEIMKRGLCRAQAVPAHESGSGFLFRRRQYGWLLSIITILLLSPDSSGPFLVGEEILGSPPPAFFADQSTPRERLGGFGFIDTTPKFFPGSFFGVLQYICRADVFVADLIFHPSKLGPFFRRINIQRFHCRLLKVRYDLYRSNAFQKGMACAKSQRFALCISQWRLF
jgi:hypothetical protein